MRTFAISLFIVLACSPAWSSEPAPASDDARWMAEAESQISRLGDDDFDNRYAAMLKLKSMIIVNLDWGHFIRAQLKKAISETADPEVKMRANEILSAQDEWLDDLKPHYSTPDVEDGGDGGD